MPNQKVIITDYELKKKVRGSPEERQKAQAVIKQQIQRMLNEDPEVWLGEEIESEYSRLEKGMIMEFTIHIL